MAKPITMVCTLTPRAGKFDRVKAILVSLAQNVHEHEEGCLKYLVLEQTALGADNPDIVLIEEWRSKDDVEKHHETSWLKETHAKLEEEDLLARPEVIRVVDKVWGFEGRDGGG